MNKMFKFCIGICILLSPSLAFADSMKTDVNINIFQAVGAITNNIADTFANKMALNNKLKDLQSAIGILITLSIMYKGYQTLAGKAQDPIRDLVWDIARKLMIMTFVFNVSGWLTMANSALKNLYSWAGGGGDFWTRLDSICVSFLKAAALVWDSYNGLFDAILACFILVFMIIGFVALIVSFAFSIVATTLTNTFLIIALPLALICFMYENTRQVFVQWCNMFLSNLFLLLFLYAFSGFVTDNISALYADKSVIKQNFILAILQPIFISGMLITCIQVIKTLASNLAQVSLDSASQSGLSSAISNPAGKVFGGTVRSSGKIALGALSGNKKSALERGGITGLAGFGVKKGLGTGLGMSKKLINKFRNS